MSKMDRCLVGALIIAFALSAYGNFRRTEAMEALTAANFSLIIAIDRASGGSQ